MKTRSGVAWSSLVLGIGAERSSTPLGVRQSTRAALSGKLIAFTAYKMWRK